MSEQKRTREQRRKELQQQKQTKKPIKLWIKRIFITLIALGVLAGIGGGALFAFYASTAPELDETSLKDPISPKLLDANGDLFATVGAENREYVPYDEIPKQMEDAILATEDARFYDHMGVDFLRLGKAVLANFTSGFGSQGASTLTQQVIKNSFLTNEKTLKRKAQEAYLAIQLERKYEKEEIFEMYFNKVLMSGRIYGFGTAAQYFYGKELKDLTLDQFAVLAGMPQSPNNYNPFKNPDLAEKRRNIVLHLMNLHGKITEEEMKAAQAIPIEDTLLPEDQRVAKQNSKYDAFIDVVLDELEKHGDGDSISDGITIHTTLQPDAQKQVEATLNSDMFPTEDIQSAVAVIDTKTGAIAAVGGGRNYGAIRGYNYAYDMKLRSPGSTIKPLLDYGPAIEFLNWSTGHTIVDEEIKYTGTDQVVRNFSGKYRGAMTMREALYNSQNVPAVKTLKEVGTKNAKEFINRFGIDIGDVTESSAIGGTSKSMSPIQMAGAYAAFGNNGVHTEPYAINKIVYRDGKTEKNYRPESKPVMKDSTAYMVTDVLRDVLTKGTAKKAAVSGLDIAGKSGTSNYDSNQMSSWNLPKSAFPDVWFAGYTTNYSIAVWAGYPDIKTPMTTNEERYLPQKIFKQVMGNISDGKTTEKFKKPNSVVEATIEKGTDPLQLASEFTPDDMKYTELFVKGTEPTSVSEKYKKLELNAPTNLKVNYDEITSTATLSWDFEKPEDQDVDVKFEVSVAIDNGPNEVLQTTDQMGLIVQSLIPGSTYVFSVTAVSEDVRSEPTSISLTLEAVVEEDLEEIPPAENGGNENPGDSSNNGNGNNNGSGNGNGNGDGNGSDGSSEDNSGGTTSPGDIVPPTEPTEPEGSNP
ncbi:PBP1A family penicillin-binding protein [Psychrobacillus vulpis]|uniref:PBP1A family penicillin-binding protein n=1 Tax=Psychrobacillus vulpis TaxID=2325572 RepID=A0A544TQM0_9BACI|nr:PBP1A family penicillin-binding protein [Psychrobacillus vulpis]TQR19742.1 PBP1A family penicillin-binding protein [Psychrobacillus vulpis]